MSLKSALKDRSTYYAKLHRQEQLKKDHYCRMMIRKLDAQASKIRESDRKNKDFALVPNPNIHKVLV